MLPFALFTAAAVAALLAAEGRRFRAGVWLAKPLASTGFVAAALAAGALGSEYGRCILGALALSWLGDVLLIPRGAPRVFRAGLASFLLGHVTFAIAFWVRGLDGVLCAVAVGVTLAPLLLVLRWLRPHLAASMRTPVHAYVFAIAVMLVFSAGTLAHAGGARVFVGALLFCVSDLAVARDRFVAEGLVNRLWGLPLYYAAQLVLASTVA